MVGYMSTVLYLANQQIQVVVGTAGPQKIMLQQAYMADAPEGSIINGIVMDSDAFVEFIRGFWQANRLPAKDVTVVINSSKFVGKVIELPKLNASKTRDYIDREFASIKKEEDEIYSFIPLASQDSKLRRIYAESIPSDFIKEYMEIFAAAGIGVKAICSGESSLISLAGITAAAKYKTFLMLIADNITLTSILWVNGSFYYFNNVRCFNQPGTPEYAMDVARSVSQIVQFMQANQIEFNLETIRLAGIAGVGIGMYREALEQMGINIPIEPFDSTMLSANQADVQSYISAASGLVTNGKWHNILNQFSDKKKKTGGQSYKGIYAIIVVLIIMVVGTVAAAAVKMVRNSKLNELEDEINSPAVIMQIDEYDELLIRNSFLNNQYRAIADIDENIASYPVCNNDILDILSECAGNIVSVNFESFDADKGLVSISATAENVDNINLFIRELTTREVFNKIDYTGYSYDNQTGLWDIHVTCTLTEAAGRQGE
jgi:hypothetical protein